MTERPGYDLHATARWAAEPPKRAAAGRSPVGQMQAALATAVNGDPDWKEF